MTPQKRKRPDDESSMAAGDPTPPKKKKRRDEGGGLWKPPPSEHRAIPTSAPTSSMSGDSVEACSVHGQNNPYAVETCSVHGKNRTVKNLFKNGLNQWECVPNSTCLETGSSKKRPKKYQNTYWEGRFRDSRGLGVAHPLQQWGDTSTSGYQGGSNTTWNALEQRFMWEQAFRSCEPVRDRARIMCAVHGKSRSKSCLEETTPGNWVCKKGQECRMRSAEQPRHL